MTDSSNLISIGQFSSMTRLSVRMLRHYDHAGVLEPAEVDDQSGYRRYAPSQLADATLVRQLRDVGFGVSAMAVLLAARGTPQFAKALAAQRDTLIREASAAQQRLLAINRMLDQENGVAMSNIEVSRGQTPAMTVVALRGVVPTYSDEGLLWAKLMPELQAQGITITGPGGCIEHDGMFVEQDPDESVFVQVAPGTTAKEPLRVFDLPAQDAVLAKVTGPYSPGIADAHTQIGAYESEHGLTENPAPESDGLVGKTMNIYLNDPSTTAPEDLQTLVYRPLN